MRAIDADAIEYTYAVARNLFDGHNWNELVVTKDEIEDMPTIQPEIIRCRECKFASGDSRICMKFDHSPIGELDFCSFAERGEVTT